MNQLSNSQVNPDFSSGGNLSAANSGFSSAPSREVIDPDFSVYPDNDMIDPDFSVFPDNNIIDPGFSVVPDRPFPFPLGPGPVIPCPGCFPTPSQGVLMRFLCATPDFSNLTVEVGNRTILNGMNLADISRYLQYSRGFQRITVMAPNGYVFLQQSVFLENNCTVAIVSSGNRMQLTVINDPGCTSASNASCLRVCNLAYYSGPVNITLSNGFLRFTNVRPGEAGSFSRLRSGSYMVSVARSARPLVNLLSTYINLDRSRVYTLYVINWNPSSDTVQILLTDDLR